MSDLRPTVVLDVPGLTAELIERALPSLRELARRGGLRALKPAFPALASPTQAALITGLAPRQHGIVADGWYSRERSEISLWPASCALVKGERVWETGRRLERRFTCAQLFWTCGRYGTADWSMSGELDPTPESAKRAAACLREVFETRRPALTLACLPQLGWTLERLGPSSPQTEARLAALDGVLAGLVGSLSKTARLLFVSGYAVSEVRAPVALNRALRGAGLLRAREERGAAVLEAGLSEAFAVADHQVAHVYVRRPETAAALRTWLETVPGVDYVLDEEGKARVGLDHPRSGELVAVAQEGRWFRQDYGPDACELPAARPRGLWAALRGRLSAASRGPLEPRGSHGRAGRGAVVLGSEPSLLPERALSLQELKTLILRHVFERELERTSR